MATITTIAITATAITIVGNPGDGYGGSGVIVSSGDRNEHHHGDSYSNKYYDYRIPVGQRTIGKIYVVHSTLERASLFV